MLEQDAPPLGGWFAGPKAEGSEAFAATLRRIYDDHCYWRRNYFPEDGHVVDSAMRRQLGEFDDAFQDRLLELLGQLKADFPFHSPRYAAHMISEQTLPSIAGYFAGMLYNPNNVTSEVAPVTVRLELEAAAMIARMLGYGRDAWSHLTGGGTVANIEAMWVARSAKYLPLAVREAAHAMGIEDPVYGPTDRELLGLAPIHALGTLDALFRGAEAALGEGPSTVRRAIQALKDAPSNVAEHGVGAVCASLSSEPVVLAPETHHYCFDKALDALGFGRRALRTVRVDADFRMDVEDLQRQIEDAESTGKHVLAVVAVVGTTEEGAVDPVNRIIDLRAARERAGKPSFWVHADAAYGGYLRTTAIPTRLGLGEPYTDSRVDGKPVHLPLTLPEHSACESLERLGECDSAVVDPHKLGYVPYPAGAVCFRSDLVKPLVRQTAPYLEEAPNSPRLERKSEGIGVYILEGSKPGAAAASVWLSHTLIPLDNTGHGQLMRATIRDAAELHALLEGWPNLSDRPTRARALCLCPPGSNIVCYAFRPEGNATLADVNALTRALYQRFSIHPGSRKHVHDQTFFVSRTVLSPSQYRTTTVEPFLERLGVTSNEYEAQGVFLLRSVLMNPWYSQAKTQGRAYLSEMVGELYDAAEEVLERKSHDP